MISRHNNDDNVIRLIERMKGLPKLVWAIGVCYLLFQGTVYKIAHWLSLLIGLDDLAVTSKISAIDDKIPFIPAFVIIYIFSFVFWVFGPVVAAFTDSKNFNAFILGHVIACIIGFFILFLRPTYMDRAAEGLLDVVEQPGFYNWILRIVYAADGGRIAYNLFPSFHCMSSLCCYIAVRGRKEIPAWFRVYSFIMVILIAASTVCTKQHYFMDVISGWLLSVIGYSLALYIQKRRGKRSSSVKYKT